MLEAIQAFFGSEAGLAAQGVLVVAVADFVLGVSAAFRDGTFQLDTVAAWLRKHIAGRVVPCWLLLVFGQIFDQPLLLAVGVGSAGLYLAETLGSIRNSWAPGHGSQPVPDA